MKRVLTVLLLTVVPLLVGCDPQFRLTPAEVKAPEAPDAPVAPATLFLGGGCEVELASINCRDASRSTPPGDLVLATFDLFRGNSTLVDTQSVDPGGVVSFFDLPLANYKVRHTIYGNTGQPRSVEYTNLIVSGGF